MLKTVDINGLFQKFVKEYLVKNKGKIKPDEVEEKTAEIYGEFENTAFVELDGKTPKSYYSDEKDLIGLLRLLTSENLEIDEYLIEEIRKRVEKSQLVKLLDASENEEVAEIALEILSDDARICKNECVALLFSDGVCEHIINDVVEMLIPIADEVKDEILSEIERTGKTDSYLVEILSHSVLRDERIKKLILDGLKTGKKIPEYADYARIYDDESMVKDLNDILKTIEEYVPYKELKMAIESLGGWSDEKDFSYDSDYVAIKKAEAEAVSDEHKD